MAIENISVMKGLIWQVVYKNLKTFVSIYLEPNPYGFSNWQELMKNWVQAKPPL